MNLRSAFSQKIGGVAAWKLGVGTVGAVLIYRHYAAGSSPSSTDTSSSQTPIDTSYYPATTDQLIPDTTTSTGGGGSGDSGGGGGSASPTPDGINPGGPDQVVVPGKQTLPGKPPRTRGKHKPAQPKKSRSKATVHTHKGKRAGGKHQPAKPAQPRHNTKPKPVTRKRHPKATPPPAVHPTANTAIVHAPKPAGRTKAASKPAAVAAAPKPAAKPAAAPKRPRK